MIKQITSNTAIVLGFLVFLLLGGRLIRYFGIAAEGGLDVTLLFKIIGYNLPYFLELILPLSFFIALMLVFGRLYVEHEMAVINGSGVSRGRLARLAMPLVILLFVVEAWFALVGKPWGVRQSDNVWQEQAVKSAFDLITPGQFLNSGEYNLYVGSFSADKKQLKDVVLIQTNTKEVESNSKTLQGQPQSTPEELQNLPKLPKQLTSKDTIVLAKRAQQVATDPASGKTQLDLFNGRRYELSPNSLKYNQVGFDRYRITLTQDKKEEVTQANVETQKIQDVWAAATGHNIVADTTVSNNGPNFAAQAELGYRFALPWLIILAPMLAVPLAQVRPRQGRWLRLIPAILLFVSAALAIISLKKPITEGKISAWAYVLLIMGLIAFALYLNWANRFHQRIRYGLHSKKHAKQFLNNSGGRS